jgi:SH3-like domain-containing protein
MTTRHSLNSFLTLAVSATLAGASLMLPMSAIAETPVAPAASADAVQQPYAGIVNDDNVYVRSGPGEIFYATTKLNKGAKITVVAARNDWLKIIPPDGSFCYVARAYVEKRGDGTVGRVTKPDLNVRAGSSLNGLKTTVQTSLSEGDDVKILADQAQDEYFKIAPPPGAYLYVKKEFVDAAPQEKPAPVPIVAAEKITEPIASAPVPLVVENPTVAVAPTTNPTVAVVTPAPATQPAEVAVAPAPATQPVGPTADEKFDTLESAFLDATNQPLEKQPIDTLLTKYNDLSTDPELPSSMKRIVDMRIATLKLRGDAQKQYADAMKMQEDARARQASLKAENQELADRVKAQAVSIYTALGTLRISSLQQSGTTMYRLTDPASGHTLLYIKSNDPKYTALVDKFIGVKGDIAEDTTMNLKVMQPTAVDEVDPAKVNTTVTATIIPPSLLPKTATANVDPGVIRILTCHQSQIRGYFPHYGNRNISHRFNTAETPFAGHQTIRIDR